MIDLLTDAIARTVARRRQAPAPVPLAKGREWKVLRNAEGKLVGFGEPKLDLQVDRDSNSRALTVSTGKRRFRINRDTNDQFSSIEEIADGRLVE